jgi:hypothetical protein
MNLTDAYVEEILEGPTLTGKGPIPVWTIRYVENCYGRKKERLRSFSGEKPPDYFVRGYRYQV